MASRFLRALLPSVWGFAALFLLAACTEPVNLDYTQRFPVGAVPETVTVPAHFTDGADPFAGPQQQRFKTLVEGYLDRGHGPLTIEGGGATQAAAQTATLRMEMLRRRLINAGVPSRDIRLQLASEGAPDTITLSYERYTAVLPTCGDWSSNLAFNPNNSDVPNAGCAQQRNLGEMVDDPADLVSAHPAAEPDQQSADRVIHAYRTGAVTESVKNALQINSDQNAATGSSVGTATTTGAAH
jgi:pilus assembly protein CpaD